jgi:thiamine biosynthesis protein ThiS
MRITINGEAKELAGAGGSLTVDELLAQLALPGDRVAVEINGVVVRRADRAKRAIVDGDVLEIVTLVGGG